jgi:mono/diheme cytochrome c family protein
MFDLTGMLILAAVAALFFFAAKRASRIRHGVLRWLALGPSIFLASIAVALIVCGAIGFRILNSTGSHPIDANLKVEATPERLARGEQLSAICGECHSTKLGGPLVGRNFFEGGGPPVGTLYAPNLTPAGEISEWTDGEVIRAIREGVHQDGRALIIMPTKSFHNMSDDDVQSVVAYLRSQPSAGKRSPAAKLNVVGALFFGLGIAETSVQPAITHPVVAPPRGDDATHGKYLLSIANCTECHGEDLRGRAPKGPGPPAAPNMIAIVSTWNADGFVKTFRTGTDPGGHKITREMPWQSIARFASDDDLKAIYAYLRSLNP